MGELSDGAKDAIDAEYDQLYAIIADTVNAACRSDILCQNFQPSGDGEYWMYGSNTILYPNGSIYVPDEGFVPDINGWNPGLRRDHFAKAIGEAFVDWDLLPDRSASQPCIDSAAATANALQLETTGKAATTDGIPVLNSGNTNLAHDLKDVFGLQGFRGRAMDTLKSQFTSYLPDVIQGQYVVAGLVGSALVAEQNVWVHARRDIVSIAKAAKDAMEQANPWDGNQGGSGEFPEWLSVVAAVAGATAAFFSGGLAGAVGAVAGAVGTLGSLSELGSDDKPGPLGAATPDEVLEKLTSAISKLRENISHAESQIARACTQATTTVQNSIDGTYALPAIKALTDEDPNAYISGEGEVRFTEETLIDIGDVYLPKVKATLDGARADNTGSSNYSAFARPGGFGVNPYSEFNDIHRVLDEALQDTAWKVDHVGQQLVLFVKEFKAVDEGAASDAEAQKKKLDAAAAGNRAGSGHSVDFPTGDRLPNGKPVPQ